MKRLQIDEKQQKQIEAFFKEETTYFPDHVMSGYCYCYYIMLVCSCPLLLPPLRVWGGEKLLAVFGPYLYVFGLSLSMVRYSKFSEKLSGKVVTIAQLMRYLPVERMQLTLFRIRKVLKRSVPYTVVLLLIRCGISLGVYRMVSGWDLLHLGSLIILPVLVELTRGDRITLW